MFNPVTLSIILLVIHYLSFDQLPPGTVFINSTPFPSTRYRSFSSSVSNEVYPTDLCEMSGAAGSDAAAHFRTTRRLVTSSTTFFSLILNFLCIQILRLRAKFVVNWFSNLALSSLAANMFEVPQPLGQGHVLSKNPELPQKMRFIEGCWKMFSINNNRSNLLLRIYLR